MSYNNPTQLQLGMEGTVSGKKYRVIGRVVMGVTDAGVIYHWNEFNLEGEAGEDATLVYEQTERGGVWRWFTMFEPAYPMTAQDAAGKRVGDPLDFGDGQVRVTLVDRSRVYFIEGKAPEGVEVGDVADYFNAEAGEAMVVVSWTGEEVEFYHGTTLPRGTVEAAFNIREPLLSNFTLSGTAPSQSHSQLIVGLSIALVVLILFIFLTAGQRRRAPAIKISGPPTANLRVGTSGALEGKTYRIIGHNLVQIEEVGARFDRHEFQLRDENGNEALLVCDMAPDKVDCCLLSQIFPAEPTSPQQAARVRLGQTLNAEGFILPVTELFRSTVRQAEAPSSSSRNDQVRYGFLARTNSRVLLVRWTESLVTFEFGKVFPAKVINEAFGRRQ